MGLSRRPGILLLLWRGADRDLLQHIVTGYLTDHCLLHLHIVLRHRRP